jgi:hypothetical protein
MPIIVIDQNGLDAGLRGPRKSAEELYQILGMELDETVTRGANCGEPQKEL